MTEARFKERGKVVAQAVVEALVDVWVDVKHATCVQKGGYLHVDAPNCKFLNQNWSGSDSIPKLNRLISNKKGSRQLQITRICSQLSAE